MTAKLCLIRLKRREYIEHFKSRHYSIVHLKSDNAVAFTFSGVINVPIDVSAHAR